MVAAGPGFVSFNGTIQSLENTRGGTKWSQGSLSSVPGATQVPSTICLQVHEISCSLHDDTNLGQTLGLYLGKYFVRVQPVTP